MGTNSKIEWTNHTWNPWRGCTKVSDGCKECYAEREAGLRGWDFNNVQRCKTTWRQPLSPKWKSGDRVFVCSISDFFHCDADKWRYEAWQVILQRPDLIWILTTKRTHRIRYYLPPNFSERNYPNIFIMPTCENQWWADERIPEALSLKAECPWLKIAVSVEPMLEKLNLKKYLSKKADMSQIIIGCERLAGNKAGRFCEDEAVWYRVALNIVRQCRAAGIKIFIKQIPIQGKVSTDVADWPPELRVREMP